MVIFVNILFTPPPQPTQMSETFILHNGFLYRQYPGAEKTTVSYKYSIYYIVRVTTLPFTKSDFSQTFIWGKIHVYGVCQGLNAGMFSL